MKKRLLALLLVVCIVATLVPTAFATGVYTDIKSGDWYADEIMYVYGKGLMNGVGSDKFAPKSGVTRAMVWTTLARLEGVDTSKSEPWYLAGQQWAMENGVSDGTMPLENVTREQLVTMMYRYAKLKMYDVSVGKDTNILSYTDVASVSSWAVEAFQWACGAGVITGVNGKLLPKQSANRAELAVMLYRFDKTTVGKYEPTIGEPCVYTNWVSNDNGTHTGACSCGAKTTQKCTSVNGICQKCGAYYITPETTDIASVIKSAPAGSTIVFAEGNYDKIVLDKIDGLWHNKNNNEGTLYPNTLQYAGPGGDEYDPETYADIYAEKAIYHPTLADNLTLVAEAGGTVTIAGFDIYSDKDLKGVGYGGINPTQATKDILCVAKNLTISGFTFTDDVALKGAFIDKWTITDCDFIGGACVNTNYNSNNKKTAAADIAVTGCSFTGSDSDEAIQETRIILFKVDGATISGNTITGAEFNAVQLGSPDNGDIKISGNTISGIADRIIRVSSPSGTKVIISDNNVTGTGRNGEMIKIDTTSGDVTLSDNTWNGYEDEELGYNNGVWSLPVVVATAADAQAALDNATPGTTIQLAEGIDYGTLVIRQSASSKVVDISAAGGDANNEKYRKIENLTILGAEGATIDEIVFEAKWVAEITTGSYIDVKNLTVKDVTFSGNKTPFNIDGSKGGWLGIDGLNIINCKMKDTDGTHRFVFQQITGYKVLKNKTDKGYVSNDNEVMTTGVKNLKITGCEIEGAYQVIESRAMENLTITNNKFKNIKARDMLITVDTTNHPGVFYTGTVEISGNESVGSTERFIRGNGIGNAELIIKNNTVKEYKGGDLDYIKVEGATGTKDVTGNTASDGTGANRTLTVVVNP